MIGAWVLHPRKRHEKGNLRVFRFIAAFSSRWSRSGPVGKIILVALLTVLLLYAVNTFIVPLMEDSAHTPTSSSRAIVARSPQRGYQ